MMKSVLLAIILAAGLCFGQEALSRAIDLTNSGNYDEADAAVSSYLHKHGNDDRANYVKAQILTHQGKYKSALPYVEKAIAKQRDKAEYHHLAAQLYEITGNVTLAIQAWEKCREYSRDSKLFVEAKNHIDYLKEK